MELIKKYETQKKTIEGLLKVEQVGEFVNVDEVEKLNAILRFVKGFINDLKGVGKFGVDDLKGFKHNHTGGNWTYEDFTRSINEQLIKTENKKTLVAIVNYELDVNRREALANAKLISNAPYLLEIAEMYYDSIKGKNSIARGFVERVLTDIGVIG